MKITNLNDSPHLFDSTIALIEKSFEYENENSFTIDFAPLINKANYHNCFIMIDENEKVLAHIGVCERKILGIPIAMLGGIAVDEAHRGEGIFKELMVDVLAEKKSEVAFFLLWSDQEKLYKKFGFHLCGTQIELEMTTNKEKVFTKTKLHLLQEGQLNEVKHLYKNSFSEFYTTIERTDEDWKILAAITSSDLYLQESQGKITSYFFMNKGQDLSGVIHEYGSLSSLKDVLPSMSSYGRVWLGYNVYNNEVLQFQFFMAIGETKLFGEFVTFFSKGKILIEEINHLKNEVYFHFNEELLALETEEFLRGILGPGIFEEIESEIRPMFISGLVSV